VVGVAGVVAQYGCKRKSLMTAASSVPDATAGTQPWPLMRVCDYAEFELGREHQRIGECLASSRSSSNLPATATVDTPNRRTTKHPEPAQRSLRFSACHSSPWGYVWGSGPAAAFSLAISITHGGIGISALQALQGDRWPSLDRRPQ
jgi:hypothetical protein